MSNKQKLLDQIEVLESFDYKTFWTFENDEPRMKSVIIFSDIIDEINKRKHAIFCAKVVDALRWAFK